MCICVLGSWHVGYVCDTVGMCSHVIMHLYTYMGLTCTERVYTCEASNCTCAVGLLPVRADADHLQLTPSAPSTHEQLLVGISMVATSRALTRAWYSFLRPQAAAGGGAEVRKWGR